MFKLFSQFVASLTLIMPGFLKVVFLGVRGRAFQFAEIQSAFCSCFQNGLEFFELKFAALIQVSIETF